MTPALKRCSICKNDKPLKDFKKGMNGKTDNRCKPCYNQSKAVIEGNLKWNPINSPRQIGTSRKYAKTKSNRIGLLPPDLPLIREFVCCVVGCQSQATDGHHFDYSEINSKFWKNRIPLCRSHHAKITRLEQKIGTLAATLKITGITYIELRNIADILSTPKVLEVAA